jgi:hypothetical protein
MPTRRSPSFGKVSRADVARYTTTRLGKGIRRIGTGRRAGEPSPTLPTPGFSEGYRPVRTLVKRDPSKWAGQPEAKTLITTKTDVGSPGGYRGAKIIEKSYLPRPGAGSKAIRPPRLGRLKKR